MAMTKKERLQMERLERLLAAERERSEKQWDNYRKMMWENVDLKLKLEEIEKVLRGEYD
jgi:hypothetical protein